MEEKVTITRSEYEALKMQSNIDPDLLLQLVQSVKDIKSGHVHRVK